MVATMSPWRIILGTWRRVLHVIARFSPGGDSIRVWLHKARGVKITGRVFLGANVYIDDEYPENVAIHDNTFIGISSILIAHFRHVGMIEIGPDVSIGPNCVIMPNVRIGQGAVVAAGSVVNRNVPPMTLVGGAPDAKPMAKVSIPLGITGTYEDFLKGLQPLPKRKSRKTSGVSPRCDEPLRPGPEA